MLEVGGEALVASPLEALDVCRSPGVHVDALDVGSPGELSELGCAVETKVDGVVELDPLPAGFAAVEAVAVAFNIHQLQQSVGRCGFLDLHSFNNYKCSKLPPFNLL